MARLQINPALLESPDYASPTYALARAPLINANTTEEQAIQILKDIWTAGNDADKLTWQLQVDEDEALLTEQRRVQSEVDDLRAQAEVEEAETLRKDEVKKNKSKYLPIPDRDVPTVAPVVAANYAIRKMEKGLYVELWYYTNAGLDEAFRNSNTIDDEAMTMLRLPNGSTSWVPAAATKTALAVTDDKNILWEDFCQAAPRMILAMEEADWPQDRVQMIAKFWGNLQVHELRSSRDPLDQKTLLIYQAEQRRLWHLAITSPRGAYNISRINEEIMRKTRDKVYWEDRRLKDYERDYRVSLFSSLYLFRKTAANSFVLLYLRFLWSSLHLCSPPCPTFDLACYIFIVPSRYTFLLLHASILAPACYNFAPACFTRALACFTLALACLIFAPACVDLCSFAPACSLFLGNQSDQRASGTASASLRRPSNQHRRRSISPDRTLTASKSYLSDIKPLVHSWSMDFQAGASGKVYSACAVCLGRHPHKIVDCVAPSLWDNSHPALAIRSNKILSMRDGRPICGDWQRLSGCNSARHDNRHLCSGCGSTAHGAQGCPRAQKIPSANSL